MPEEKERIKNLLSKIEHTYKLDPALAINACNELKEILEEKYKDTPAGQSLEDLKHTR